MVSVSLDLYYNIADGVSRLMSISLVLMLAAMGYFCASVSSTAIAIIPHSMHQCTSLSDSTNLSPWMKIRMSP